MDSFVNQTPSIPNCWLRCSPDTITAAAVTHGKRHWSSPTHCPVPLPSDVGHAGFSGRSLDSSSEGVMPSEANLGILSQPPRDPVCSHSAETWACSHTGKSHAKALGHVEGEQGGSGPKKAGCLVLKTILETIPRREEGLPGKCRWFKWKPDLVDGEDQGPRGAWLLCQRSSMQRGTHQRSPL